jgi:hypothetical protein
VKHCRATVSSEFSENEQEVANSFIAQFSAFLDLAANARHAPWIANLCTGLLQTADSTRPGYRIPLTKTHT